ncbi:type II toxin-antitoxin system HipA family toxin [uncultured Lamprocystis sp.]|uniref:type II toxin-antitoxin system HipA family toxin n=1 Tax=uncultured Lamprocystis sp. TaxID=543132 RepID=UPI0025E53EC5|nr:type II toxin-antitoxin system HipA family toxin [uncultured Lamprocystis sp.]
MAALLRVLLNDLPVGTLSRERSDGCAFRLLESYKQAYPRPVLGQAFLDDLDQVQRTRSKVPSWFSNLLPEGPLRALVAQRAGVLASREFFLLRHLGEDLPGAVRIVADPSASDPEEMEPLDEAPGEADGDSWHFSLAGVQLKFSARRGERGLTIPVSGRGGDWIVKLPDSRYPRVPENEYATMRWAEACGIPIPELEPVDVADITGLPEAVGAFHERRALAVRRFDRRADGSRVHMEDFAQILGLYPEEKYKKFNYETLARVIWSLAGEEGLAAFLLRLVFMVASGNGDAHHKNWTLLYPDGVRAVLSPAYDQVATIPYKADDTLALNLAKSKRWEDVTFESFQRMARKIGVDPAWIAERVRTAVDRVVSTWSATSAEFGYDRATRAILVGHMKRIPLLRGDSRA